MCQHFMYQMISILVHDVGFIVIANGIIHCDIIQEEDLVYQHKHSTI